MLESRHDVRARVLVLRLPTKYTKMSPVSVQFRNLGVRFWRLIEKEFTTWSYSSLIICLLNCLTLVWDHWVACLTAVQLLTINSSSFACLHFILEIGSTVSLCINFISNCITYVAPITSHRMSLIPMLLYLNLCPFLFVYAKNIYDITHGVYWRINYVR